MESIIKKDYVVVDRVFSSYLKDFVDAYGEDMELGQDSYFTLHLSDFEEYLDDYPGHKEALMKFQSELVDCGATKCVVLYWW